ncbi:hypothetical protein D030_2132 [Vibrio parahaemolyticus AQ3810]|nr:hypothetical protein D030_2132 [Vibrio parahaemolyticus AQ3810]
MNKEEISNAVECFFKSISFFVLLTRLVKQAPQLTFQPLTSLNGSV